MLLFSTSISPLLLLLRAIIGIIIFASPSASLIFPKSSSSSSTQRQGQGRGTQLPGRDICIELTAKFQLAMPDGVQKEIITLNDQFPGPTIRARLGDTLKIRVRNKLVDRRGVMHPTSVHFHGIEQLTTPWFDGPEQVAQCPIPYNSYMDYTFKLYQSGTYWYHSHNSWQYIDGFWGLLIIDNNPSEVHRYDDDMFMTLNDWHYSSGAELTRLLQLPLNPSQPEHGKTPIPDSALINGQGNGNCTLSRRPGRDCDDNLAATLTVFDVIPQKTYRIRVINTSARSAFNFSIDHHQLRAIEVDGVDTVEVYPVNVVTIWPAQRYSFLVTMNSYSFSGNAWIRADIILPEPTPQDRRPNPKIEPLAVLHYLGMSQRSRQGQDDDRMRMKSLTRKSTGSSGGGSQGRPPTHEQPWGGQIDDAPLNCNFAKSRIKSNRDKAQKHLHKEYIYVGTYRSSVQIPLDPRKCLSMENPGNVDPAPTSFNQQVVINATFHDDNGFFTARMNNVSYRTNTEESKIPAIFRVMQNQTVPASFCPVNIAQMRRTVQLVINNLNNGSHPYHFHGHTFWVLGTGNEGDGAFDPVRDGRKLSAAGLRRDTTHTPPQSWVVVRFRTDNPGVWLLHCHINWHLELGLGAVFIEGPEELRQRYRIPDEARRVCKLNGVVIRTN